MSNEIRVEVEGVAYLVGPRVASGKFGTPDHVKFRREGQPGSYRLAHPDSPLYTVDRQVWQARYDYDRTPKAEAVAELTVWQKAALDTECGLCHAAAGQPCRNTVTGWAMTTPHRTRVAFAQQAAEREAAVPKPEQLTAELTFQVAPSYAAILSEAAEREAAEPKPEPRTAEVVGAPDTELARRVLDLLDRGGTVDDVRRMVAPAAAAVTEVRVLMDSHVGGEASFVAPDGVRVAGTVYHICGLWQVLGSRRTVHPDLSGTLNLWARQNGVQGGLSVSLVRPEQD
jgi:hypothetical protein